MMKCQRTRGSGRFCNNVCLANDKYCVLHRSERVFKKQCVSEDDLFAVESLLFMCYNISCKNHLSSEKCLP